MGTVFIILKLTSLCGSHHPHHLAQLHLHVSSFWVLLLKEQQSSFLNKKMQMTCDKSIKKNITKNKSTNIVKVLKRWRLQHAAWNKKHKQIFDREHSQEFIWKTKSWQIILNIRWRNIPWEMCNKTGLKWFRIMYSVTSSVWNFRLY